MSREKIKKCSKKLWKFVIPEEKLLNAQRNITGVKIKNAQRNITGVKIKNAQRNCSPPPYTHLWSNPIGVLTERWVGMVPPDLGPKQTTRMITMNAIQDQAATALTIEQMLAEMEADIQAVEVTHSVKKSYLKDEWVISAKTREELVKALTHYKTLGARLARSIVTPAANVRPEFACYQAYVISKTDLV
jgi:hypothetical protein